MPELFTEKTAFCDKLQELIDAATIAISGRPDYRPEDVSGLVNSVAEKARGATTNHCLSCSAANWFVEQGPDESFLTFSLVQRGCAKFIPLKSEIADDEGQASGITLWTPFSFCSKFEPHRPAHAELGVEK